MKQLTNEKNPMLKKSDVQYDHDYIKMHIPRMGRKTIEKCSHMYQRLLLSSGIRSDCYFIKVFLHFPNFLFGESVLLSN